MAVLLTACGHRIVSGTDTDLLVFSSDSSAYSDSTVEVKVNFDYPVAGPQPLTDSLIAYIFHQLDINSPSDDAIFTKRKELATEWQEMSENGFSMQLYYTRSLTLLLDTTLYVTLQNSIEEFHGGPHGSYLYYGQTFRKSDGLRIGYVSVYDEDKMMYRTEQQNLLKDTDSPAFCALLKEGVRQYFADNEQEVATDEQLAENLLGVNDINHMPLPQYPPHFIKEGLSFIYQQYEIAPYAAGLPSFIIPYDKIRPFLTKEALSLIE